MYDTGVSFVLQQMCVIAKDVLQHGRVAAASTLKRRCVTAGGCNRKCVAVGGCNRRHVAAGCVLQERCVTAKTCCSGGMSQQKTSVAAKEACCIRGIL
jgi:hypothetical protein